jgi:hypothetical protein
VSKRKRKTQQSHRPRAAAAVDAWGGWTVAADGRTVVALCGCGEPAVADCPLCGPQCTSCFLRGA